MPSRKSQRSVLPVKDFMHASSLAAARSRPTSYMELNLRGEARVDGGAAKFAHGGEQAVVGVNVSRSTVKLRIWR